MKFFAAALAGAALTASGALAEPSASYIAMALSDGPSPDQRVVIVSKAPEAGDAVRAAYRECYRRAADGYMHTCQVGFGKAWVVGAICASAADPGALFAVETDDVSPEAAKERAFKSLRDQAGAPDAPCREIGEYNANDMETARSVAKDAN